MIADTTPTVFYELLGWLALIGLGPPLLYLLARVAWAWVSGPRARR